MMGANPPTTAPTGRRPRHAAGEIAHDSNRLECAPVPYDVQNLAINERLMANDLVLLSRTVVRTEGAPRIGGTVHAGWLRILLTPFRRIGVG
jgi:hypothetical protein